MQTTRRAFLSLIAVTAGCPAMALTEQGQGLFWRVETNGRSAILFGYLVIPASLVPDIVNDGVRMIDETSSVIFAYDDFNCPTVTFRTTPLLPRLSPAVANEVRRAIAASGFQQPALERADGVLIEMLLIGEGGAKQDPRQTPSVGGVIADRMRALRRPVKMLLTGDEIRGLICRSPDNPDAMIDAIDEKQITSVLELRRQVGQIHAYVESRYAGRKSDELARHFKYLADHQIKGMFDIQADAMLQLLFTRLWDYLPSLSNPFVFLPVETLIGPGGILERFRQQGADVSVIA
jgi:hypothetical protein